MLPADSKADVIRFAFIVIEDLTLQHIKMEPSEEISRSLHLQLESLKCLWRMSSRKTFGWSKGRSYYIDNGSLFCVFTNTQNLNYLNLEEYHWIDPAPFAPNLTSEMYIEYNDSRQLEHDRRRIHESTSDMVEDKSALAHFRMENFYSCRTMLSLLSQWNTERFRRLVNYRSHMGSYFESLRHSPFFIKFLLVACRDSSTIVDYCRKKHALDIDFLFHLPSEYIVFLADHLEQTDHFAVARRFSSYVDFLLLGFLKKEKELIKMALDRRFPTVLHPDDFPEINGFFSRRECWPRRKDGIMPRSFNSCEYYAAFTNAVINATLIVNLDEKLVECFLLIWRAYPIPRLRVDDIRMGIVRCADAVEQELFIRQLLALRSYPADVSYNNNNKKKKRLEEIYTKLFLPISDIYMPRSLRDLARCFIRQHCPLPEDRATLPLPTLLKKYLDLEM